MPDQLFVPCIVLLTSLIAYFGGRSSHLRVMEIFGQVLECVGRCLLFFVINSALVFVLSLTLRIIGLHVSLYVVGRDTVILGVLSAAQGLFFHIARGAK